MKTRWLWLLALPYVVISSQGKYQKAFCVSQDDEIFWCSGSKDRMEDLAAALNEAHRKRIRTEAGSEWLPNISTSNYAPFDYKSACGQDDCGQEPK